jgi:enediyne biosynthesis protein E4
MKKIIVFALIFSVFSCTTPNTPNTKQNSVQTNIKFEDVSANCGINFQHNPNRSEERFMPEVIGSGVAIADFNRDGSPDVVLVNGGKVFETERTADAKNRLYFNDGKGKFTDKTDEWNLTSKGYGLGVAVGDFDNDGWTDIFFTSYEGDNRLLRNTGTKFEDITESSGIKNDGKWATSAGFFDAENDGDLDLFVVRYVNYTKENRQKTYRNRLMTYSTPLLYEAVADQLWLNDGKGKFTDASKESGISSSAMKGLALALGDIDSDGDTDIYVANDTTPNQLWINDGKGKFKDMAQLTGCAYSEIGKEEASMGADFSDFDSNGLQDITVANFQDEVESIYSQKQPMLFTEISDAVGVGMSSRAKLKFGVDFFDADNDGDEDLFVANGHIEDNIEQNSESVTFAQQNLLYENLGTGKFQDISNNSGNALLDKQVSRGIATADFDGDGDLDFIVSNNGGKAQIAFNQTEKKGNFVGLWLDGSKTNRNAIGTRLIAKIGDKKIERQIMGSQSYLSISDFRVHFGLGEAQQIDELTINWLGSEPQIIKNLQGGKYYYIKQGQEPVSYIAGEKQIGN